MKKLGVIGHADSIVRKVASRTELNDHALRMAVARIIKSDTMELRAKYVIELIEALADSEFHNGLDYQEQVGA